MKRLFCLCIAALFVCALGGCGEPAAETVFAMDTVMQLQVWGADAETVIPELKRLIAEQEQLWSFSALEQTPPSGDFLRMVEALSERTAGAFDPRLGGAMAAWGFYDKQYRIPSAEELREALAAGKWDLGAAVKGYTGDLCAAELSRWDVDRAILNMGGNIQTYGEKPGGEPWNIAIQNPGGGDPVGTLAVTGTTSVVTSGDYQRYFEKDGVRYHHILDPKTGMPAQGDLSSVTVICRDGLTADVLSTALFVMGLEEGSAFWRTSDDFEAVFITREGDVYATQGAALSGCEYEVIRREN